jgi:hypothetical protein
VARRSLSGDRWRRWLGQPDSWRRIIITGATAGVTLAFVAALIAALVAGGGGSSLDDETPTAPAGGPVDTGPVETAPPAIEAALPTETPVEAPEEPTPTEPPPEPTPTEAPVEPTPTLPSVKPTPEATPPEDGPAP